MIEVYIHIQRYDDLVKGNPVNVKFNYADQYDLKILLNPKYYDVTINGENRNLITVKKKKILGIFRRRGI